MFVLLAGESILSSLAKELTIHYNACDKKKKKKEKVGVIIFWVCIESTF